MPTRRLSMVREGDRALSVRCRATLLATVLLSLAEVAVYAGVTVPAAADPNQANEIKAPSADVRYGWRISSDDAAPPTKATTVIVRTTLSDPITACGNARRCTLGWRLDGQPLAPNSVVPVPLTGAQSPLLTYEGRAEALGLYQSRAIVSEPLTVIDVRLRRVLAELGTGAIVVGPIGGQNLPIFGPRPAPAGTIGTEA